MRTPSHGTGFLRHVPGMLSPLYSLLMSDGAKGLESESVKSLLDSYDVQRARCAWHIIHKNLKEAKVGYKE